MIVRDIHDVGYGESTSCQCITQARSSGCLVVLRSELEPRHADARHRNEPERMGRSIVERSGHVIFGDVAEQAEHPAHLLPVHAQRVGEVESARTPDILTPDAPRAPAPSERLICFWTARFVRTRLCVQETRSQRTARAGRPSPS